MNIRYATPDDYLSITRLLRQLNPESRIAAESERKAFDDILNSSSFHLLVVELDSQVTGTCYLNIIPNISREGRPYAVIENVVTDKEHRKKGLGQALIAFATGKAREEKCYKIMLMTGRENENLYRFYKKCGFDENEKKAFVMRIA